MKRVGFPVIDFNSAAVRSRLVAQRSASKNEFIASLASSPPPKESYLHGMVRRKFNSKKLNYLLLHPDLKHRNTRLSDSFKRMGIEYDFGDKKFLQEVDFDGAHDTVVLTFDDVVDDVNAKKTENILRVINKRVKGKSSLISNWTNKLGIGEEPHGKNIARVWLDNETYLERVFDKIRSSQNPAQIADKVGSYGVISKYIDGRKVGSATVELKSENINSNPILLFKNGAKELLTEFMDNFDFEVLKPKKMDENFYGRLRE